MLHLTRYANALFLFFLAGGALTVVGSAWLSSTDTATKLGALIGSVGFLVAVGAPYYFSFKATKSKTAKDVRRALISSSVLLLICFVIIIFGFFSNSTLVLAGFLWSIPSLLAVMTLKNLETVNVPVTHA